MGAVTSAPRAVRAGLPFYSKYTYRLHLRAELLNNLFAAVIGLAGPVARKGLQASDIGITIFTTAGSASLLTALFWSYLMEGRAKRPFIIAAAILGRATLVLTAFATTPAVFIGLFCIYFLSEPIFLPAQNALFQANYRSAIRGRVFGVVTGAGKVVFLFAAYGAGELLDYAPRSYLWLFPAASVLGFFSYLQYARIRIRRWEAPARAAAGGLWGAVKNFFVIMRKDRNFDRFERNFMLYGMAFMMVQPINLMLLVDELHLSYRMYSLCTLVMFQVIGAVTSPYGGTLLDRIGAPRLASAAFAILVLYAAALGGAALFESRLLALAGFFFFGIAMSGVNSAWSLGAMKFAGDRDAAAYMGAHVACVGVRGLFGPTIGLVLALGVDHLVPGRQGLGLAAVYTLSAVLFAAASVAMLRLGRRLEMPA